MQEFDVLLQHTMANKPRNNNRTIRTIKRDKHNSIDPLELSNHHEKRGDEKIGSFNGREQAPEACKTTPRSCLSCNITCVLLTASSLFWPGPAHIRQASSTYIVFYHGLQYRHRCILHSGAVTCAIILAGTEFDESMKGPKHLDRPTGYKRVRPYLYLVNIFVVQQRCL